MNKFHSLITETTNANHSIMINSSGKFQILFLNTKKRIENSDFDKLIDEACEYVAANREEKESKKTGKKFHLAK